MTQRPIPESLHFFGSGLMGRQPLGDVALFLVTSWAQVYFMASTRNLAIGYSALFAGGPLAPGWWFGHPLHWPISCWGTISVVHPCARMISSLIMTMWQLLCLYDGRRRGLFPSTNPIELQSIQTLRDLL